MSDVTPVSGRSYDEIGPVFCVVIEANEYEGMGVDGVVGPFPTREAGVAYLRGLGWMNEPPSSQWRSPEREYENMSGFKSYYVADVQRMGSPTEAWTEA